MNTALWIVAGTLSLAYVIGGVSQLLVPKERLRAVGPSQHWVDDFGAGHIQAIGCLKLLGATGLVVPALLDVVPVLVPLAASGLMLVMAGAGTTRFRRSEWRYLAGDLVFLSLLGFVAWGRFGPHAFG